MRKRSFRNSPNLSFGLVALLLGAIGYGAIYVNATWNPYVVWLAAWGGTAFLFYGWDKSQAQRGGWRVPENVLHGLALIGGFIGAWAGMFLWRHKVRHLDFWLILALSTLFHVGLAAYWFL